MSYWESWALMLVILEWKYPQGSTCGKYLTAPCRHTMRTGCCTLEVILSLGCMHAKTGTRSVCKQKKKCVGEEPISSSSADSLVNRQEAPGQYYSDARCEGTAGTHDSSDVFYCSAHAGSEWQTGCSFYLPHYLPTSNYFMILKQNPVQSRFVRWTFCWSPACAQWKIGQGEFIIEFLCEVPGQHQLPSQPDHSGSSKNGAHDISFAPTDRNLIINPPVMCSKCPRGQLMEPKINQPSVTW